MSGDRWTAKAAATDNFAADPYAEVKHDTGDFICQMYITSLSEKYSFPAGTFIVHTNDQCRIERQAAWLKEGIAWLHAIGFHVMAVVTDNSAINFGCKTMLTEADRKVDSDAESSEDSPDDSSEDSVDHEVPIPYKIVHPVLGTGHWLYFMFDTVRHDDVQKKWRESKIKKLASNACFLYLTGRRNTSSSLFETTRMHHDMKLEPERYL